MPETHASLMPNCISGRSSSKLNINFGHNRKQTWLRANNHFQIYSQEDSVYSTASMEMPVALADFVAKNITKKTYLSCLMFETQNKEKI